MSEQIRWLGEQTTDGHLIARIGRTEREYVAEFPGVAVLRANRQGTDYVLEPHPGADAAQVSKLDRGAVKALIRHLQGKITLHAGAVSHGGRAVALLGRSGVGKSTLVAQWCAVGGASIVADDTAALDFVQNVTDRCVYVLPGETDAWLHAPSRHLLQLDAHRLGKVAVPMARSETFARPVAAFVSLVFTDTVGGPQLRSLRGQDAFAALSTSMVRFIIDEPWMQAREVDQMQMLVKHCPIFELRRPKSLEHADASLALLRPLLGTREGANS